MRATKSLFKTIVAVLLKTLSSTLFRCPAGDAQESFSVSGVRFNYSDFLANGRIQQCGFACQADQQRFICSQLLRSIRERHPAAADSRF
jgi:hypothetical protein